MGREQLSWLKRYIYGQEQHKLDNSHDEDYDDTDLDPRIDLNDIFFVKPSNDTEHVMSYEPTLLMKNTEEQIQNEIKNRILNNKGNQTFPDILNATLESLYQQQHSEILENLDKKYKIEHDEKNVKKHAHYNGVFRISDAEMNWAFDF